jgi:hypothetical protein
VDAPAVADRALRPQTRAIEICQASTESVEMIGRLV